ncbi:YtzH-like family protein [Bacillus velezensis]|uniref:YtzH-like family protein n=1 Tax=Bacillus velezensis TaxID=492670 RepID=UPI003CF852F4
MGLTSEHQVRLLMDILADHQLDCCGTVAEYEQLERVIKSLMANTGLDSNIKNVLEDVYRYSQSGITADSIDTHIQEHQNHLSQWVEQMDSYS